MDNDKMARFYNYQPPKGETYNEREARHRHEEEIAMEGLYFGLGMFVIGCLVTYFIMR